MYQVQMWDDDNKCVHYHSVPDAIDYDDAAEVVKQVYPDHRLLGVTKTNTSD